MLSGVATSVANAARGDASAVAPGSIASIYGFGLASSIAIAGTFPLPPLLGGASVSVNGQAAPLFYAGPNQINFLVPALPSGNATVIVTVAGAQTAAKNVTVRNTAPGIFLLPFGRAAAVNRDGSVNSPDHPAPPNSPVAVYATGLGTVSPPVTVGAPAPMDSLSRATATVTAT